MNHAHVRYIVAPIVFVGLIIDLPFTLIADTVLLPIELFVECPYPRATIADEFEYSSMDLIGKTEKKNPNQSSEPILNPPSD